MLLINESNSGYFQSGKRLFNAHFYDFHLSVPTTWPRLKMNVNYYINLIDIYLKMIYLAYNWVGDGWCSGLPPYNTTECGYDGGDCIPKPVKGYQNCTIPHPDLIGDKLCDSYAPYNTPECGYDGGDCNKLASFSPSTILHSEPHILCSNQ